MDPFDPGSGFRPRYKTYDFPGMVIVGRQRASVFGGDLSAGAATQPFKPRFKDSPTVIRETPTSVSLGPFRGGVPNRTPFGPMTSPFHGIDPIRAPVPFHPPPSHRPPLTAAWNPPRILAPPLIPTRVPSAPPVLKPPVPGQAWGRPKMLPTTRMLGDVQSRNAVEFMANVFTGIVEAFLGGSSASAPESKRGVQKSPRRQSGVAQVANIALMRLPFEKLLGYGLKGVMRLLGKEAKAITSAEREFLQEVSADLKAGSAPTKEVAPNLARGNFGEKQAADSLAAEGHRIISYKPDVSLTSQAGIDIVTLKDGVVYFLDNKALTRTGSISSVSSLTTSFDTNKAAVVKYLQEQLGSTAIGSEVHAVFAEALAAIQNGKFKRVVTNANFVDRAAHVLTGVTDNLKKQGIEFMNVMPPVF
jgi:hypothetical protein